MALPLKNSELICFYDIQYRWNKRSTPRGVEVNIELNEFPDGQRFVTQCPRIFRADMVEEILENARDLGWTPEVKAPALYARLTKKGLRLINPE